MQQRPPRPLWFWTRSINNARARATPKYPNGWCTRPEHLFRAASPLAALVGKKRSLRSTYGIRVRRFRYIAGDDARHMEAIASNSKQKHELSVQASYAGRFISPHTNHSHGPPNRIPSRAQKRQCCSQARWSGHIWAACTPAPARSARGRARRSPPAAFRR